MPAVSVAQQRLFSSALRYKLHGGEVPQRVKNLSNLPEETLRDFTVLAPGVKSSRATFPTYAGKGPGLSKELKESLKTVLGDKKFTADTTWRQLKADPIDKTELAVHLEDKHNVSIADEKYRRVRTLGHLQHLLNNSLQKKAGSPQIILIAGHSGAGKSTLAKNLAERLGGKAYQIDDYPEFVTQMRDNTGIKQRLTPGTPENKKYMAMLHRAVKHTLANVDKDKPALIEGAQFSIFPKEKLLKYPHRIYVGGKVEQSMQQRIARSLAKEKAKGNEVTEEDLKGKQERTKLVAKQWHDGLMDFRRLPGTLRYNHSHNDLDTLVERIQQKKANVAVVGGIHGDEPAGNIAAKKLDGISDVNPTHNRTIDGKDPNRHFGKSDAPEECKDLLSHILKQKPKAVISLHEDDTAKKPYGYASPNMTDKLKETFKGVDTAKQALGDKADKGVITDGKLPTKGTLEKEVAKEGIPYATIETPKSKPLGERVSLHEHLVRKLQGKLNR